MQKEKTYLIPADATLAEVFGIVGADLLTGAASAPNAAPVQRIETEREELERLRAQEARQEAQQLAQFAAQARQEARDFVEGR
jgi:hypothetical protein